MKKNELNMGITQGLYMKTTLSNILLNVGSIPQRRTKKKVKEHLKRLYNNQYASQPINTGLT